MRVQTFKVYVITSADIRRFILIEIVIGMLTYNVGLKLLHNAILAGTLSFAGTESIKRSLRLLRRKGENKK
ncbi:hypothetical protein ABEW34_08865 [Paenibacillus algorifonticola]|uniref:hypothetical protein n=1 Tax=Paenibacillus algorifonticola TaxID=684063 RepID=UPI003D26AE44